MAQDKSMNLQVAEFASLFKGNLHNYGQHVYEFSDEGEKENGKSFTVTDKLITKKQYQEHLSGTKGLGVIPITDENKCYFSVIDVDLYDTDLMMYVEAIEKNNFPLVPFRSKSGGLHIYCFFKNAIAAADAIKYMQQFAALLAIDSLVKQKSNRMVEVFPKQGRLKSGTVGSWINLPYFNAKDTNQWAWRDGHKLSIEDAIVYIHEKRLNKKEIELFFNDMVLQDAPPCLQNIYLLNPLDENTGRNNYLFSFGVYLKKKDESSFEQNLHEINQTLNKPIPYTELNGTIISSLKKKDYTYKCTESPCFDFCNKTVCKTREFGIGKDGGYFSELEYGEMRQIRGSVPYYEWEVRHPEQEEFKKLVFRTEAELTRQTRFLDLCMRELHYVPNPLKRTEWIKVLNQGLTEMKIIRVDPEFDISPVSIMKSYIHEFIFSRVLAQTKHQVRDGRVYFDNERMGYYFQKESLMDFLINRKRFNLLSTTDIQIGIKDMGIEQSRVRDERGRQFRVYFIPKEIADDMTGKVELPANEEPIEFDEPEIDFSGYEEGDY